MMGWGAGNTPGGPLAVRAPDTRTVCQLTGEKSAGPTKFFEVLAAPPPVDRAQYDFILAQRDKFEAERDRIAAERDGFRAELDNMMGTNKTLGKLVADLTSQSAMWHADRDEQYDVAEEWRDKAERYLATIDDLEGDVRSLLGRLAAAESARDTANAKASL